MRKLGILTIGVVLGQILCAGAPTNPAFADLNVPLAAPIGVRVETVYLDGGGSKSGRFGPRPGTEIFANESGRTLYTTDRDKNGRPTCYEECALEWPPFVVHAGGQPVGEWSIIVRDDRQRQWALAGRPLYIHAEDKGPAEFRGEGVGGVWKVALKLSHTPDLMPIGFDVIEAESREGESLVRDDRRALYFFDGDDIGSSACFGECARKWPPLKAPRMAFPMGHFTVIDRIDGIKQWAYRGKPLYTFADDDKVGVARGDGIEGHWHQMMLTRYYFPPSVKVVEHARHGTIISTANGTTLYARESHYYGPGQHNSRARLRGDPEVGLRLGFKSCLGQCLQKFVPLEAPENVQPWGRWTVVTRPDGVKQWAYRNYPLFTYKGDSDPGDAFAHDMYELTDGSNALFWRVALP